MGAVDEAAENYAAALAAMPDSPVLARRALGAALTAGNWPLAFEAAYALDEQGRLPRDGRILLLADAVRAKDWTAARKQIEAMKEEELFAFLAPIVEAWIVFESAEGSDPVALLDAAGRNVGIDSYVAEHRALLLLAAGRHDQGLEALAPLAEMEGGRAQRLKIATAALLAERGKKGKALRLLRSNLLATSRARAAIAAGKPLPALIDNAADGIAEFFVRVAIDLHRQDVTETGLTFARLATLLAPDNSETWLVTSELLDALDQHALAIEALGHVSETDPFAPAARQSAFRLNLEHGERETALGLAEAAVAGNGGTVVEWMRLGDLYGELGRHGDAAEAYGSALGILERQGRTAGDTAWQLWLLRGSALHRDGRWPEAEKALRAAYALAPDEPVVLNDLGYSLLERREHIDEAMALIERAAALDPDSGSIADSLGWAHYLDGDVASAIEHLERAVKSEPADPTINEHLGDAYFRAGRRFEARHAWTAALVYAEGDAAERLRTKIETGLTPEVAAP
ncbi:MAG: tetratricopeptide repeat protein [Sphingomonadaceae bacterium]